MDRWYVIYPDQEVDCFEDKESWRKELWNLESIYGHTVIGNTCYLFDEDGDWEEIDWED